MNRLKNIFVSSFVILLKFINRIKTKIRGKVCHLSTSCFRFFDLSEVVCWAMLILVLFLLLAFVAPFGFSDFSQQQDRQQKTQQNTQKKPQQNKHIGVVNITGIIDGFVKTQAKNRVKKQDNKQATNSLPQEEIKKRVQAFGKALEKTLREVSSKNRIVLMPSEAVIAGATDYTREVQKRLTQMVNKCKEEV